MSQKTNTWLQALETYAQQDPSIARHKDDLELQIQIALGEEWYTPDTGDWNVFEVLQQRLPLELVPKLTHKFKTDLFGCKKRPK
jgi:hypothetical protein